MLSCRYRCITAEYSCDTEFSVGFHTLMRSHIATAHALDFTRLLQLESFKDVAKIGDKVKSVVIINVDGGPDENPRYAKTIASGVCHSLEHDLDALFYVTNAPGRGCFNRAERRMAPLNRELSGVILPHDTFGNHLNSSKKTIDFDLERRNFANAGKTSATI
ncbi:hypothetical protein QAD02_012603 [Eretmocerus hayati]|uniref:Uncharacterized protein n=1 Tax=Eretmocerus hayati TaxID=131215 RepID=A0ACC2P180_9HYME|nr:hypothetical protein QAD02_012603 [Eretmocerus hayati]